MRGRKMNIKIIYTSKDDKFNSDFEMKLSRAMEKIGCRWWSQGFNMETGERDICFDYEIEQ